MKKYTTIILLIAVFSMMLPLFTVEAGIATVSGSVTEPDGITPVAAIEVSIKVIPMGKGEFTWRTVKVKTDNKGFYKSAFSFPDIPEIAFLAEAEKTEEITGKRLIGNCQLNFFKDLPNDKAGYEANISLMEFPLPAVENLDYTATIQGFLFDAQTGEPLRNWSIMITQQERKDKPASLVYPIIIKTDEKGFYQSLLDLHLKRYNYVTITFLGENKDAGRYIKGSSGNYVYKGRAYTKDFYLNRNESVSYIYGMVTNAQTGDPMPYALVKIKGIKGTLLSPDMYTSTDFMGRYYYALQEPLREYNITTVGTNTDYDFLGMYERETVRCFVEKGKVTEVNFRMNKKLIKEE